MTSNLTVAIAASLASATAYGAGSAVQFAEAAQLEQREPLDPRLITALVRRPIWLLGIVSDVLAVALQAVGLRYGPVVLVQPLLVAALPIAVLLSAAAERRRPTSRESTGLVACVIGLVLMTPALSAGGPSSPIGRRGWFVAAGLFVAAIGALLLAARFWRHTAPVAVGVAAGVAAGAGSVLLAVCARDWSHLWRLLGTAAPYATVAVGLLALVLTQAAFQTGALAAPLAALSVTEPAVAVVLAATVLREQLPQGAVARAGGALGAALSVVGVLVLAMSRRAAADPVP